MKTRAAANLKSAQLDCHIYNINKITNIINPLSEVSLNEFCEEERDSKKKGEMREGGREREREREREKGGRGDKSYPFFSFTSILIFNVFN